MEDNYQIKAKGTLDLSFLICDMEMIRNLKERLYVKDKK